MSTPHDTAEGIEPTVVDFDPDPWDDDLEEDDDTVYGTVHTWLPDEPDSKFEGGNDPKKSFLHFYMSPRVGLMDSLEPVFLSCIQQAARSLVASYPGVEIVVVRAHSTLINLMLLTCSRHPELSPEAPPATMHIRIDNEVNWSHALVEITPASGKTVSTTVHYTPGLDVEQNEIFTRLLGDGFSREDAAKAAGLLG